jgi:phosphohistidine phosphatase
MVDQPNQPGAARNAAPSRPRGPGGRFIDAVAEAATKAASAAGQSKAVARAEETARMPDAAPNPDGGSLALYLLRHADAGDPEAWTGDDAERPLSKKGRKQARRLGSHLESLKLGVDAIVTSPKVRAAETAKLVGKALGVRPTTDERLAGGFGQASLRALIGGLDPAVRSVVLVGHDPDFSGAAGWLTRSRVELRKGAVAKIELPSRSVAAGVGTLRWLLPPDAVRG